MPLYWTESPAGPVPPAAEGFLLRRRAPHPAWRDAVAGFTLYRETCPRRFRQVEPATLVVPMIVSFGAPFAIGLGHAPGEAERYGTFAAGLFAGPVLIESFGQSACLQVDFTPQGARRFFGLPMRELTGHMVPLDAVLDLEGRRLRQRLGEEPDWERRFDLAESFVYTRLSMRPAPSPAIGHAVQRLTASHGRMRIADITAELEWSRKHLAQRFSEEIGLAPKTVARMLRFRRLLALACDKRADWADLAFLCGYADQAHMAREFVEFSGETPSAWRARFVH